MTAILESTIRFTRMTWRKSDPSDQICDLVSALVCMYVCVYVLCVCVCVYVVCAFVCMLLVCMLLVCVLCVCVCVRACVYLTHNNTHMLL